jgi:hypothetical protein
LIELNSARSVYHGESQIARAAARDFSTRRSATEAYVSAIADMIRRASRPYRILKLNDL